MEILRCMDVKKQSSFLYISLYKYSFANTGDLNTGDLTATVISHSNFCDPHNLSHSGHSSHSGHPAIPVIRSFQQFRSSGYSSNSGHLVFQSFRSSSNFGLPVIPVIRSFRSYHSLRSFQSFSRSFQPLWSCILIHSKYNHLH
jgi:hypothetical protein